MLIANQVPATWFPATLGSAARVARDGAPSRGAVAVSAPAT